MRAYPRHHQKQPTPTRLRPAIGALVFDHLLDGLSRKELAEQLERAGATTAEMNAALKRYDTAGLSVVGEVSR